MAADVFVPRGLNQKEMAEFAIEFRRKLGIGRGEPVDIVDILEFELGQFYPGYSFRVREDDKVDFRAQARPLENTIIVSESTYDAACEGDSDARFILAHELGHFLLHADRALKMNTNRYGLDYEKQFENLNSLTSTEAQADIFARHFLAPCYLAFQYRSDPHQLSVLAGIPLREAKAACTISKRDELYSLRQSSAT
ncbi:ImmA/IrrE family metallo-endopeptidase [Oceaniradius stylonematis]|uniref:ImmA/IrrE family metallo-endopeptidase n=1 Tax=Oceaniradius stylonematis TaxID=2184161 RepID=UPI00273F7626|nr:ImmA/IrrE family metallo-endopeptidase [Oceaniradius stylonematis]